MRLPSATVLCAGLSRLSFRFAPVKGTSEFANSQIQTYCKDKRGTLYIIVFSSPEDNFKSVLESSVILYFWFHLLGSPPVKRQARFIPRTEMFKLIAGATEIFSLLVLPELRDAGRRTQVQVFRIG